MKIFSEKSEENIYESKTSQAIIFRMRQLYIVIIIGLRTLR